MAQDTTQRVAIDKMRQDAQDMRNAVAAAADEERSRQWRIVQVADEHAVQNMRCRACSDGHHHLSCLLLSCGEAIETNSQACAQLQVPLTFDSGMHMQGN